MNELTLKEKTESLIKGFFGDALDFIAIHVYCGVQDLSISWSNGPSGKAAMSFVADNLSHIVTLELNRNLTFLDDDLTDEEYADEYAKYWDISFPWTRADSGELPVAINPLPVVIKNGQLS